MGYAVSMAVADGVDELLHKQDASQQYVVKESNTLNSVLKCTNLEEVPRLVLRHDKSTGISMLPFVSNI